ncbi:hypothetical protein FSB76_05660 [Mucilaginibacter ginsenosidivorax]|uniref:Uncharacterized protein n=1 Tax=Mucilaginibacter ginsenosidivorax TaxID=862126 RepID=A0A5B8VYD5_9SPHI|nr:hypothetical protein FSB76_05660 [Mucilaginibacter ginsenosidivorax]
MLFLLRTQNSELRTQNSELRTQNSELRTHNSQLTTSPDTPSVSDYPSVRRQKTRPGSRNGYHR